MKRKYNEIFKLKDMLESTKIPFDFSESYGGYYLSYPSFGEKCVCSVVEHNYSYGEKEDLLEILGLTTEVELEETQSTVLGYLTAENVFQRIKKHWELAK